MQLNTVIFDMDGLLIDSEPLWNEAAAEVFRQYGLQLSKEQYDSTTGMRIKEFVLWWFGKNNISSVHAAKAEDEIIALVIHKVKTKARPMQGLEHIFNFFISRKFKIGLASSSPTSLIDVVVDKLGIRNYINAINSAAHLPLGKPHPQVYLNCADDLQSSAAECVCFEDSFNGLVAAKAAGMKCVVVPAAHDSGKPKFNAADLKISSLQNFNDLLLHTL
ncbi:MAG: hexitol phosphatase HxpB [Chitinophagaceae bacterium]|nr:hexitol phosphatase HxpB [Chitinophagaceae bacterium]